MGCVVLRAFQPHEFRVRLDRRKYPEGTASLNDGVASNLGAPVEVQLLVAIKAPRPERGEIEETEVDRFFSL